MGCTTSSEEAVETEKPRDSPSRALEPRLDGLTVQYAEEQEGLTTVPMYDERQLASRRNPLALPENITSPPSNGVREPPRETSIPRTPETLAADLSIEGPRPRRNNSHRARGRMASSLRQSHHHSRRHGGNTCLDTDDNVLDVQRPSVSASSRLPAVPPAPAFASPAGSVAASSRGRSSRQREMTKENVAIFSGFMSDLQSRMQSGNSRTGVHRGFNASGNSFLAGSQSNMMLPGDHPFVDMSMVSLQTGAASNGTSFVVEDSLQMLALPKRTDDVEDPSKTAIRRPVVYKLFTLPPTTGASQMTTVTDKTGARVQSHLPTQSSAFAVTKWLDIAMESFDRSAAITGEQAPEIGPPVWLDPEFGDAHVPERSGAISCGPQTLRRTDTDTTNTSDTAVEWSVPPSLLVGGDIAVTPSDDGTPSSRRPPRGKPPATRSPASISSAPTLSSATLQMSPHELFRFPRQMVQSQSASSSFTRIDDAASAFLASQSTGPSTMEISAARNRFLSHDLAAVPTIVSPPPEVDGDSPLGMGRSGVTARGSDDFCNPSKRISPVQNQDTSPVALAL